MNIKLPGSIGIMIILSFCLMAQTVCSAQISVKNAECVNAKIDHDTTVIQTNFMGNLIYSSGNKEAGEFDIVLNVKHKSLHILFVGDMSSRYHELAYLGAIDILCLPGTPLCSFFGSHSQYIERLVKDINRLNNSYEIIKSPGRLYNKIHSLGFGTSILQKLKNLAAAGSQIEDEDTCVLL